MQRTLVYSLTALLVVVGTGMVLSFTAGGVMFGLGCFTAALALWLLYRGVVALELSADLLAQSLLHRSRSGREHVEATARRSEEAREDSRSSQPAPAGD